MSIVHLKKLALIWIFISVELLRVIVQVYGFQEQRRVYEYCQLGNVERKTLLKV